MLELILYLWWEWAWTLFDNRNVRHALRVQLLLHSGCWQSLVVTNAELLQTIFQSAAANRVHNQRKLIRFLLPVCRPLFPTRISSSLETEEFSVVAEVCSKIEAQRAVDVAEMEHNSLCVVRSPDDDLQVFRAKVNTAEENFFRGPRCCPWERVDVELRLYSGVAVWRKIDIEQFDSCGSAVTKEAGEVCICVWNVIYLNSFEVG